jgi:hypothetical protein
MQMRASNAYRRRHQCRVFRPFGEAGATPRQSQDMRLQSGARDVARQSRQIGRQAQTVQIIP